MARKRAIDVVNTVTRGFVTEYSSTNFPREAAIDLDNVIIDTDSTVRRRGGIDLEQGFVLNSINGGALPATALGTLALTTHLWKAVNNSGTLNIVVQQIGVELQFYAQFGAVSANLLGTYDLSPHAIGGVGELRVAEIQVASGLGDLYVCSSAMEPLKITLSSDGLVFEGEEIALRIRDFDGVDDGLATDVRPIALFRAHYYNLINQGWTEENILKFAGLPATTDIAARTGDAGGLPAANIGGEYDSFGAAVLALITGNSGGDFPSNSDIMTTGIVTNKDGDLEFDANFIREGYFGNTPAPRGHFILDAFHKDYSEALGVAVGSVVFGARPEAIAFFQGRAYFTAPTVQGIIGGVYYSQQLVKKENINSCFQEADPTASEINDLINTDGGYLPMPAVGSIKKLSALKNGILVYATNGVEYITGADQQSGITATNIRLDHITDRGVLGSKAVVSAGSQEYYWSAEGIEQVVLGETGTPQVQSVSKTSIQSFYINISAESRRNASGIFLPEQGKIYWAYRDIQAAQSSTSISYNKFLVLDLAVKGFYKYSIGEKVSSNFPEVVGLTLVASLTEGASATPLLELDGSIMTELDGSPMTIEGTLNSGQVTALKCATLVYSVLSGGYKLTYSTFHSRSFHDWKDFDPLGVGINYSSYIEFAEFNMQALHTRGTASYVHSFFQKTSKNLEPNGYWELPPLYYKSTGVRLSQSVLEVLNKPSSNLRVSQSVVEVVGTVPSDLIFSSVTVETLYTPA